MNCTEATNLIIHNQAEEARILALKKEMRLTEALDGAKALIFENSTYYPERPWNNLELLTEEHISEEVLKKSNQMWPVELSPDGKQLVWMETVNNMMRSEVEDQTLTHLPLWGHANKVPVDYADYFTITDDNIVFARGHDALGKFRLYRPSRTGLLAVSSSSDLPYAFIINSKGSKFASTDRLHLHKIDSTFSATIPFTGTATHPIDQLRIIGDDKYVLACGKNNLGYSIWNIAKGEIHNQYIQSIADIAPMRKTARFCYVSFGTLGIMNDIESKQEVTLVPADSKGNMLLRHVAVEAAEERFIVSLSSAGKGIVYDLESRRIIKQVDLSLLVGESEIIKLMVSADKQIILALKDGRILFIGKKKPNVI